MLQKTIKRSIGSPESVRLYKFTSAKEMDEIVADYKQNFTRSVTIVDNGRFNKSKVAFINGLANEPWDDMHITDTDYFLLTREDLGVKDADEKRKTRLAKRGITTLDTSTTLSPIKPIKTGRITDWTPAQMAKLYSGTIQEVATALGKTYAMVYNRRKKYEEENPTFVVPECATRTVQKKEITRPAYKQIVSELTQAEVDILWSNSSAELRNKYANVFQSIFVISNMRTEYCKQNPDFVIPLAAKFNSKHLPNKVEEKVKPAKALPASNLTADEMSIIWDASGKEVGKLLNKHYNAIYSARIAYCKANPDFVIPAISGFKVPAGLNNQVETVQTVIEPAILVEVAKEVEQEVKQVVEEPTVEIVTEKKVLSNLQEEPIKKKRGRKPKAAVEAIPVAAAEVQVAEPVQAPAAQPVVQNTMAEMFALLTASGMMPKKATFTKEGEVSFEF